MRTQSILLAGMVIILATCSIGVMLLSTRTQTTPIATVTTFTECAQAGFPVAESMPRTCRDKNGNLYIEMIATTSPENIPPHQEGTSSPSQSNNPLQMIRVTEPTSDTRVSSPLTVKGEARGNWYFEASFPIQLLNASGTVIAQGIAQAQGDWMTTNFVPFTATLNWSATTTGNGTLRLQRDNPSGLPENDAEIIIPVVF